MKKIIVLICLLLICAKSYAVPETVSIAQSLIGKGETCGDNCGQWVKRFLNDDSRRLPWCAGFVSYVLQESDLYGYMPYILTARSFLNYGKRVVYPLPGDLMIQGRGLTNSRSGHVGIVESVKDGYVTAIEGNSGSYPARVKRVRYRVGHIPRLIGYVRLKPSKNANLGGIK